MMTSNSMSRAEPEVHVVGQLLRASGFDSENAFCVFDVKSGPTWTLLGGETDGQTQTDYAEIGGSICWNHPIDLHYFTTTIQGWPRLQFEVWRLDEHGGREIYGYSFVHVPTQAGHHEIECPVWRPCGSMREEVASFFIGGAPQLKNKNSLYNSAKDERIRISSVPVGTVHLELDVILRHFGAHDISWE